MADSVTDVAMGLVELCRAGRDEEAVKRYYDPEIVSVEAGEMPGMGREVKGLDAIRAKHQWWYDQFEMHECRIEGPFINGDAFTVYSTLDCTHKPSGQRSTMQEIACYTVSNGKIVHEAFFALPGDCG